jgi:hypothetical protein
MHIFTKVLLLLLAIVSIIEVFSDNPHSAKSDQNTDEHDFREFDEEPAEKYAESAQEEHIEIRQPSEDTNVPGKSFIPPMNMPPIRFAYW